MSIHFHSKEKLHYKYKEEEEEEQMGRGGSEKMTLDKQMVKKKYKRMTVLQSSLHARTNNTACTFKFKNKNRYLQKTTFQ
jgi:hypothetical protein